MTKYELLYVIPGKYSEEEIDPIMISIKDLLKKHQAQLVEEKNLGKKKLAYPIKQTHYGYYILNDFDLAGENIAKIDQALKLMPEILRHQIVHRLEPSKTIARVPREKLRTEETMAFASAEPLLTKEIPTPAPTEQIKETLAPKKPKISLAELDQKLDEILKEDII